MKTFTKFYRLPLLAIAAVAALSISSPAEAKDHHKGNDKHEKGDGHDHGKGKGHGHDQGHSDKHRHVEVRFCGKHSHHHAHTWEGSEHRQFKCNGHEG